jgi:chemotaxis protein methyltransferase CheR
VPITAPRGITEDEFRAISGLLAERTGIRLSPGKETLVMGRLDKRLRHLGLASYRDYIDLLRRPGGETELRRAIDLLTTNETFFFREPRHFEFLRDVAAASARSGRQFRMWSAASSSGEEAYTAAMVLADAVPSGNWEIVGTDISSRVVESARRGLYPIEAAERIPRGMLRRYCRRGREEYTGFLAIAPDLRAKVTFLQAYLLENLGRLGQFDVIMLRNVMIYFELETKVALIHRMRDMMRPDGYLIVSLSETLKGLQQGLRLVEPSVYTPEGSTGV